MQDPFQTLNMPPRFDLNEAELHAAFIRLSAEHHPDRHTDPVDQAQAAEKAAEVNQAYNLLRNPETRADALLKLKGGPAKEDDKSLPPDLLMEMMEIREQLEQAAADNNQAQLDLHRAWAGEQRDKHLTTIADLFRQHPNKLSDDAAKNIRLELNTLRYIQRMIDQMPG